MTEKNVQHQVRRTLLEISQSLTKDDLDGLKFLCEDEFGKGRLAKMTEPFHLFKEIIDTNGSQDKAICLIVTLLKEIKRPKLSTMLEKCLVNQRAKIQQPDSFHIHRHYLSSTIMDKLKSNQGCLHVVLVGNVGTGKTELIKEIICKLHKEYLVISPLEVSAETKFADLLQSISSALKHVSLGWQSNTAHIISTLEGLGSQFILSLDIGKVPHTHSFCEKTRSFLNEVQLLSNCKLVISTARYPCKKCHKKKDNTINVKIPPWNIEECTTLMKHLETSWDYKSIQSIFEFCCGSPLLLHHFAEKKDELYKPFGKMNLNCLHDFTPDDAFKYQVKNLDKHGLEGLVYFHQVKEEFPIDLAVEILDLETQEVINACLFLEEQHLLVKCGKNFRMPQLIRHYTKILVESDQKLKKIAKKSKMSMILLFVEFLYEMNKVFMGYEKTSEFKLFNTLLNEVTHNSSSSHTPKQILAFYKHYEHSFGWVLKEGTKNDSLKVGEIVAYCVNECVSFLAKAMDRVTIIELFASIEKCGHVKKDKLCYASTLVSKAFLRMYHNGCQEEATKNIKQLEEASRILISVEKVENSPENLNLEEVTAHCYAKLGHLIVSNNPQSFLEGFELIERAIDIRKKETERGHGSQALVAAGYVDMGHICRHGQQHSKALFYYKKGLKIYQEVFVVHPFMATTMDYMAECYQNLNMGNESSICALVAKQISDRMLGEHLDTARFIRRQANVVASRDKTRARCLYDSAIKTAKSWMRKEELIDLMNKSAVLSNKDDATGLRREIEQVKNLYSVEWENKGSQSINPQINRKNSCHSKLQVFEIIKNYLTRKPDWSRGKMCIIFLFVVVVFICFYFGGWTGRHLCKTQ